MSTSLPIGSAHDREKRLGASADAASSKQPIRRTGRAATRLWRAFVRWQIQRLEQRIAEFQPGDRLLLRYIGCPFARA
jgi:hypothetical protein